MRMKFQQRMVFEFFDRFIFRDRFTSLLLRNNCHLPSLFWIAPNVCLDSTRRSRWFALDKREIGLLHLSQAELILQPAVSAFVFCQKDQPRSLLIETMDDTGAFLAANPLEGGRISEYRVDQRPRRMTRRRVDNHTGRFIDHNQIFVFEYNVERNILGNQACRSGGGNPNRHGGTGFQRLTSLPRRATVHLHQTACDQSLNPGTRKLR